MVQMGGVDVTSLVAHFKEHGQDHVFEFWDQLTEAQQHELASELQAMDLPQVWEDFHRAFRDSEVVKLDDKLEPLPEHLIASTIKGSTAEERESWVAAGLERIAQGKVAAILLAGGQGTRLGTLKPKGMYDLGLPSGRTLFNHQALRIRRLQEWAGKVHGVENVIIPWYIMTSGATQEETRLYLEANNFFGLQAANVVLFEQDFIPCLTTKGKLILDSKFELSRSPDGNGGLYNVLKSRGILDDMSKRGIENIHVYGVDNILVKVADPVFIGYCASKGTPAGNKVVPKDSPNEAVGVLCKCEGRFQVVEYSEITPSTAELRNSDNTLTFNAGNICNHFFTLDFLKFIASDHLGDMKLHLANKKIPYVASNGERVTPPEINGIKIEKFVFDVFAFADSLSVLEVNRLDEFSPLKNATGKCTVQDIRADLYDRNRRYLAQAGVVFIDNSGDIINAFDASHVCEISPLLSYAGENLDAFALAHPTLKFPVLIGDHGDLL